MISSGIFYLCEGTRANDAFDHYREGLRKFQSKYNVSAEDLRDLVDLVGGTELDQYEDPSTAVTVDPWGYNFPDLYTSMSRCVSCQCTDVSYL